MSEGLRPKRKDVSISVRILGSKLRFNIFDLIDAFYRLLQMGVALLILSSMVDPPPIRNLKSVT